MNLPRLIVHADWGTDPSKRMMCIASCASAHRLEVTEPEFVGDLGTFFRRLLSRAEGECVVMGFDFPIGVPTAYAKAAGIESFREALPDFGKEGWEQFYDLAVVASEIRLHRPFYPYRPGGTKQQHLLDGLGIPEIDLVRRRCEQATANRGAASPLFWTLGAKQVGRAAIIGWRDLIGPAMRDPSLDVKLWPFDGDLHSLVSPGRIVVAETYPAEAGTHIGIDPPGSGWSKTSQDGRRRQARRIVDWSDRRGVRLSDSLVAQVQDGFGASSGGEDPFDATVGLLAILEVVLGHRSDGVPELPEIRAVEGWILGQADSRPSQLRLTV